jgi:hypothetical protein
MRLPIILLGGGVYWLLHYIYVWRALLVGWCASMVSMDDDGVHYIYSVLVCGCVLSCVHMPMAVSYLPDLTVVAVVCPQLWKLSPLLQ